MSGKTTYTHRIKGHVYSNVIFSLVCTDTKYFLWVRRVDGLVTRSKCPPVSDTRTDEGPRRANGTDRQTDRQIERRNSESGEVLFQQGGCRVTAYWPRSERSSPLPWRGLKWTTSVNVSLLAYWPRAERSSLTSRRGLKWTINVNSSRLAYSPRSERSSPVSRRGL